MNLHKFQALSRLFAMNLHIYIGSSMLFGGPGACPKKEGFDLSKLCSACNQRVRGGILYYVEGVLNLSTTIKWKFEATAINITCNM